MDIDPFIIIIMVIFLAAESMGVAFIIWHLNQFKRLADPAEGLHAQGLVVEKKESTVDREPYYTIKAEYPSWNNQMFSKNFNIPKDEWDTIKQGDRMAIRYLKSRPKTAVLSHHYDSVMKNRRAFTRLIIIAMASSFVLFPTVLYLGMAGSH